MVPWSKLPKDLQTAILTLVLSGSATTTHCCPPIVCDPPPPPATASMPIPSRSSPFPKFASPTPKPPAQLTVPVICDPPPPPMLTRIPPATPTPAPAAHFKARRVRMSSDSTLSGAAVNGTVIDGQGRALSEIRVTVQSSGTTISAWTASDGSFVLRVPNPGEAKLVVGGDNDNALPLDLKQWDVANVEWVEQGPPASLPLAEIRSVDIVWGDDLTFKAESPWPDAHYRWSVSGGTLVEERGSVTWQPPSEPGRYLLQLIADWGNAGLAVDSLTLAVTEYGAVVVC